MSPQHRFLVVRAKPDHPDAWLTNRLISDFVPVGFRVALRLQQAGLLQGLRRLERAVAAPVVDTLKTTYLKDKAAFRARLYGLVD